MITAEQCKEHIAAYDPPGRLRSRSYSRTFIALRPRPINLAFPALGPQRLMTWLYPLDCSRKLEIILPNFFEWTTARGSTHETQDLSCYNMRLFNLSEESCDGHNRAGQ